MPVIVSKVKAVSFSYQSWLSWSKTFYKLALHLNVRLNRLLPNISQFVTQNHPPFLTYITYTYDKVSLNKLRHETITLTEEAWEKSRS